MNQTLESADFAPLFQPNIYTEEERHLAGVFFTNLDKAVYSVTFPIPELVGALCSRASRTRFDLRNVFLKEYALPFVKPVRGPKDTDQVWQEKVQYGSEFKHFIDFLNEHPILDIIIHPRARSFYFQWLAQFGDESIAQMTGTTLAYWGISQIAIKHFENQRIGLAPIEKSTRYVDYSGKLNDSYLYYIDPTLEQLGLAQRYKEVMDGLFDTYSRLKPKLNEHLRLKYEDSTEKSDVVEKKVFDTLRVLLPVSTLSQVAFFGNGQAFEHLCNRSLEHPLGEIRWAASEGLGELNCVIPSLLSRLTSDDKRELMKEHQIYLAQKGKRVAPFVEKYLTDSSDRAITPASAPEVRLIDRDPYGEARVIAGILYDAPGNHRSWDEVFQRARQFSGEEKREILDAYLSGRKARWQKVGRAFEHLHLRFEIVMNIGAWRDLQRHRMHTQQNQLFSTHHGYDVPEEVVEAGLESEFREPLMRAGDIFLDIEKSDPYLAQYSVPMAYRVRFTQYQNARAFIWEDELRTTPECHPDYRYIEQEKFRLFERAYLLLAERLFVNLDDYVFARRGQEEKIQARLRRLRTNR